MKIEEWRTGARSIGFETEFRPTAGCRLFDFSNTRDVEAIQRVVQGSPLSSKPLHIVLIGDSTMERLFWAFRRFFAQRSPWKITYLTTRGMSPLSVYRNINIKLEELGQLDHSFFVVFNIGLHDIEERCWSFYTIRKNQSMYGLSCISEYQKNVQSLITRIKEFSAVIRVWQSTSAAWPKYGNFGNAWPTWGMQPFPKDPSTVNHINTAIWDILQQNEIPVMDAYWLTLARPDHRETHTPRENHVGMKLSHAGPDVYLAAAKEWLVLVLERLDPDFRFQF